jgi:hypothetical protein
MSSQTIQLRRQGEDADDVTCLDNAIDADAERADVAFISIAI